MRSAKGVLIARLIDTVGAHRPGVVDERGQRELSPSAPIPPRVGILARTATSHVANGPQWCGGMSGPAVRAAARERHVPVAIRRTAAARCRLPRVPGKGA
jgi:hypothetical protein